ncbi:MAG: tetratricopeptide repeat protein [Ruminococcaceae bacterium]|nr:tetratricopeptide repeat protein [Oscillospiraceae bacterium]
MIDLKHEARNFAAMNMPEISEATGAEDTRWAYSLYNKALQYIKKGYEDLARQNLKKAIGLNPDFYPARMLLGVCLFANGDRVGAMRMFNAIKDMRYKRLALSYYDYLAEEVNKSPAQSGSRLILKDLYKAAAASEKTLSDVTEITEEKPEVLTPNEIRRESIQKKLIDEEPEIESLAMGQLELSHEDENSYEELPEENLPQEGIYDEELEIPSFFNKKPQTVITSRKNDGVVEEIVKQKREEAQKVARYSGTEKRPFEFDHVYKKQIFGENPENTDAEQSDENGGNGETVAPAKDSILISVASVIVLVFMIITSVLLMHNVTENRKLKNELDALKKYYIESQITPTPKPDVLYTFEPAPTPEATAGVSE